MGCAVIWTLSPAARGCAIIWGPCSCRTRAIISISISIISIIILRKGLFVVYFVGMLGLFYGPNLSIFLDLPRFMCVVWQSPGGGGRLIELILRQNSRETPV